MGFRLISQLPPLIVIAMFVAILLTLSRGWRDSEMAIWMSSGQSLLSWVRPCSPSRCRCSPSPWCCPPCYHPGQSGAQLSTGAFSRHETRLSVLAPGYFRSCAKRGVYFVEGVNLIDGTIKNVFVFADDPNGQWRGALSFYQDKTGDRYVILEKGNRVKHTSATAGPNEYEFASFVATVSDDR